MHSNNRIDVAIKHKYGRKLFQLYWETRCTRGIRVDFSVTRMRSSNSARMNKSDFTNENIV